MFRIRILPFVLCLSVMQSIGQNNPLITAAPFLTYTPDARAGGMGEVGCAVPGSSNALHWNLSGLAFTEQPSGISATYAPWYRALVPNSNLFYGTVYGCPKIPGILAGSFRYFSSGGLPATGSSLVHPYEYAADVGYARVLGTRSSAGISLRYIYSAIVPGTGDVQAGKAFAVDVSYTFKWDQRGHLGVNISNIGSKMRSDLTRPGNFLPANIRLGASIGVLKQDKHAVLIAADINKLLVPTPPDPVKGQEPDRTVPNVLFTSFNDAPGGLEEEWREIAAGTGGEYVYNTRIAFRAGYFYEHASKGYRNYLTFGTGLRYHVLRADVAFVHTIKERSPYASSFKVSLSCLMNPNRSL